MSYFALYVFRRSIILSKSKVIETEPPISPVENRCAHLVTKSRIAHMETPVNKSVTFYLRRRRRYVKIERHADVMELADM